MRAGWSFPLRRWLAREGGASLTEYMALIALLGLIVLGVAAAAPGMGATLATGVRNAVCGVFGGCAAGTPGVGAGGGGGGGGAWGGDDAGGGGGGGDDETAGTTGMAGTTATTAGTGTTKTAGTTTVAGTTARGSSGACSMPGATPWAGSRTSGVECSTSVGMCSAARWRAAGRC